jgi:hypothetical protein
MPLRRKILLLGPAGSGKSSISAVIFTS